MLFLLKTGWNISHLLLPPLQGLETELITSTGPTKTVLSPCPSSNAHSCLHSPSRLSSVSSRKAGTPPAEGTSACISCQPPGTSPRLSAVSVMLHDIFERVKTGSQSEAGAHLAAVGVINSSGTEKKALYHPPSPHPDGAGSRGEATGMQGGTKQAEQHGFHGPRKGKLPLDSPD